MFQTTHPFTVDTPVDLAKVRFLIVDSEGEMRSIYRTILKNLGASYIDEATDSVGAINLLCGRSPNVVILEHYLTPCSGIELTEFIRTSPASPNPFVPIVMVAAGATIGMVRQARDAGVSEFLAKPLTARTFCDRIAAVLSNMRTFVKARSFVGPDRRRHRLDTFMGRERRTHQPTAVKVPTKFVIPPGELLMVDAA